MNVTGAGTLPVLTNVTRTSVYCFYTVLHFASNVKYTLIQDPKNTKNYCWTGTIFSTHDSCRMFWFFSLSIKPIMHQQFLGGGRNTNFSP